MKRLSRWWLWLLLAGLLIGGGVFSILPQPIPVDVAILERGPNAGYDQPDRGDSGA